MSSYLDSDLNHCEKFRTVHCNDRVLESESESESESGNVNKPYVRASSNVWFRGPLYKKLSDITEHAPQTDA